MRRVIGRHDGADARARARSRGARRELMPAGRAAAFNQAMMELGATVCRPRRPECGALPGARGLRVGGPRAGAAPRRAAAGASASRTATAGRAGGSSPRSWPASRRPRWRRRAASGAEAGLLRDGLAVRGADGALRLP